MSLGKVILVGAGPGDPELLTLKADKVIQQADVIVYDYLVSDEIIARFPAQAKTIYVGKRHGNHSASQTDINQILIDHALLGQYVVRLKGGDPFIFGRGGEEIEALLPHQIPFEIIPGITAASGCTTYAGIPLTHRGLSQGVQFITGHCQQDGKEPDWSSLARYTQGTLVFYMGLHQSQQIQTQLIQLGRSSKTPIAIIENGTKQNQRIYIGVLSELIELSEQANTPSLIIVGDVVTLSNQLHWFSGATESVNAI